MSAQQQAAIPVAQTVAGAMPSAPPLADIQDFTGTNAAVPAGEEAHTGGAPDEGGGAGSRCALTAHAGAPARYWSPEEMKTLTAQAVPVDPFRPARGQTPAGQIPTAQAFAAAAVPVATATAVPVLTTSTGVPVTVNQPSACVAEYDGYTGVKSCDPRLNNDVAEVMRFLQTYNTRPRVAARCHGYHRERRTRRVRDDDGDWRTETYYVTVTDFDYRVDLSQFVFPFGFIQSVDPNGRPIPAIIQAYFDDDSKLKTLKMYKEIGFDFRALGGMVHGYIRQLGWWRGLSVTFPRANYRVKIWASNWLSDIWESCLGKCLCYMSIIGCCIMNCIASGHKQDAIRSFYQINYHPLQPAEILRNTIFCCIDLDCISSCVACIRAHPHSWLLLQLYDPRVFAMIRPQLWCPGFSGARMAAEVMRDIFW